MRRTALMSLLVIPVVLAACSSPQSGDHAAASRPASKAAAAAPAELERVVVRTASIAVRVKDASAAADQVVAIADRLGGRVDSDQRSEAGDGSATMVLRVPPGQVQRTLSEVSRLGKEVDRSVSDKDVTAQSVDVASRVATQRASVERVRALLARAQSLSDITRIEGELTRREADLESLQNRQKALAGQVELAAVTVALNGTGAAGPVEHASFLDGLSGGWHALVGTARVLAVVAGALLPWSWLVALFIVTRVAWRRWRSTAA